MITVYYEKYWNDFCRRDETKTFYALEDVADWIFSQMRVDYSDKEHGWVYMYFPTEEKSQRIRASGPSSIEFMPESGGPTFWIHKMTENGGKIIFTDGKMTAGQKHWSQEVRAWLVECDKRRKTPRFDFVE